MVKVLVVLIISSIYVLDSIVSFMYSSSYTSLSKKLLPFELVYIDPEEQKPDCDSGYCSWTHYSLLHEIPPPLCFHTNYSLAASDFPMTCVPDSAGYSLEDFERVFPQKKYEGCEEKTQIFQYIVTIDAEQRTLKMVCDGWYYLGNPSEQEAIGNFGFTTEAKAYQQPVLLENNEEWAYASCNDPKVIEGATYRHRKDQKVIEKVKAKMKNQQTIANSTYKTTETMPITLLFLVVDSVSRSSFYRSLPLTQQALQQLDSSKFSVYDFKLHNNMADNSLQNQFPTWSGKPYTPDQEKSDPDLIWKILREKGWATLFGEEFCNDYLSRGIGEKPEFDHIMSKFWCAGKELSGYDDVSTDQRCIGNKNSHEYTLNYTLEYVLNYQGLNKYAYVMILAAHESSGTVIQTLDQELSDFIQKVTQTKDELLLFVVADHGMRYGEWFKSEEGRAEYLQPSLFLLASNRVLARVAYSSDVLLHNSNRIVGKLDLYETVKFIADIPYRPTTGFPAKESEDNKNSVNLFRTKIPNTRTCKDIAVTAEFCSCNQYLELDIEENQGLVAKVAEEIIFQINENTQANPLVDGFRICKRISLERVIGLEWVQSDELLSLYKIHFLANDRGKTEFKVFFSLFSKLSKNLPSKESFPFAPIYYSGKQFLRILDIKVLASQTLCKKIKILKKDIPDYCICEDINKLAYYFPSVIEKVTQEFEYIIAGKNKNCQITCAKRKMEFSEVGLRAINYCRKIMEIGKCSECSFEYLELPPSVKNSICYLTSTNFESNGLGFGNRICACTKP